MDRPSCLTCLYWEHKVRNRRSSPVYGECRRLPPVMLSTLAPLHKDGATCPADFANPLTCRDDWCGEHPDFPVWIESLKTTRPPPETEKKQADS